ncbi:MAG: TonB-dependent receptor [Bryobacteraceae bacterium]
MSFGNPHKEYFLKLNLPFFLLLSATMALAQFDSAAVLGTVRDSTGATVAEAGVHLESLGTGVTVSTTSDAEGNYQFLNIRIGQYRVSAAKSGFKTANSDTFAVTVAARQRVDLNLQVGEITETVTVTEAAALLETDTSSRSTVVGNKQIVDLPLNGRSYADLTLLVPGTTQALRGSLAGRDASYHVNGLRSSYNNFTLDGIENNAYGTSNQGFSNQVVQLSPDAVGEFRVTTNNFSAEYGRAGGAVINASLRSGTNDFHVTLWEFLRNTKLNAQGFFKPQFGKPVLIQNQFGAAVGGRIIRNKTFFFADYEGFRRTEKSLRFADLPTADLRAGQLGVALVDPFSGQPFSGTAVPASRITPFASRVLADLPAPNRPGSGALGVGLNYESLPAQTTPDNKGDIKVDHYFTSRLNAFFRYSRRETNAFAPPNIPGPSGGGGNGNTFVYNKSYAGAATYSLSAISLLEFRFGVTLTDAGKTPVNAAEPHIEETYGIRGIPKDPRIGGGLNTQGINGFTELGRQSSNPQFQNPTVVNPRFNYSHILGRHSLKTGYEYQAINTEINDLAPVYGRHAYAGAFSRPAGAAASNAYNFADFLLGAPSTVEKSTFVVLDYRQRMHFFYLQDDFKVNQKLTLNLGARYEFATPQWDAMNRIGNYDPSTNSLLFAKDGSIYDRSLIDPDRNNFAPRIGLAYQLSPKTVVRSGYGVSYVHFNRMGAKTCWDSPDRSFSG